MLCAQNKLLPCVYRNPIDIPIFLSGTFGELRSNHFHSGIDIRTANTPGHAVHAVEDGYVSRMAVSSGGYGKALYINHPDGHTTVYAHLQQFGGEIAKYLKSQQYKQERFEVNLYPPKGTLLVKKGQIIALSGNSGSSEGPHLHFEIRDTKTEEVLNPLAFGIKVNDKIKPVITRIVFYPIDNQSYANNSSKRSILPVSGNGANTKTKQHIMIEASGKIAFGITTSDQLDGMPNINGIYSVTLVISNTIYAQFVADRFAFDETRYINSLIDYDFFQSHKSRILRSEVDPYNRLSMYKKVTNHGILEVEARKTYEAEYIVKDFQGNTSRLSFTVKGITARPEKRDKTDSTYCAIQADEPFEIKGKGFYVQFVKGNFYRDQLLDCKAKEIKGFRSQTIQVGSPNTPVHQRYKIGIQPIDSTMRKDKLLIVAIEKGKKPIPMGGNWENGFVVASVRTLGDFVLMADTIPPQIKPITLAKGGSAKAMKRLQIAVQDDLSGISTYRGTLNDQWILMDYDAKNNMLTYDFDEMIKQGKNKFVLTVIDNCGNRSVFNMEISY